MLVNTRYNTYNQNNNNKLSFKANNTGFKKPDQSYDRVSFNNKIDSKTTFKGSIPVLSNISKNIKAIHQERIAKKLGVKAYYGSHFEEAIIINKCLKSLKEQGYLLPKEIYCDDKYFETSQDPQTQAVVFYRSGKMYIRGDTFYSFLMTDTKTKMGKYKFLVLHELGHYNLFFSHEAAEGKGSYDKYMDTRLGPEQEELVLKEIGLNATSSYDELGADVFAKLQGDEPISDEIMEIYKSTSGKYI